MHLSISYVWIEETIEKMFIALIEFLILTNNETLIFEYFLTQIQAEFKNLNYFL